MPSVGRATAERQRQAKTELELARTEARAVAPLAKAPPLPKHLGRAGKAVWQAFWPERLKTMTASEVHVVVRYCELNDRRAALLADLETLGWSVQGSRPGMLVRRAEADVLATTETEMRHMERVLGLGPLPRARLQIEVLAVQEGIDRVNGNRPVEGSRLSELRRTKE